MVFETTPIKSEEMNSVARFEYSIPKTLDVGECYCIGRTGTI